MSKVYFSPAAFLCLFLFSFLNGSAQVYYPAGMSNTNLSSWLDASDASTITTGYVSIGATATTTFQGITTFLGGDPDRLPTSKDLRATIPIGTQIKVGSNLYTVTGSTATYLTVTPNITTIYTTQAINRLAVSKWADKSGTSGRDLQSPVALVNFSSTETTSTNEPTYLLPATGNPAISFINTGSNATAQYLQGTGTAPYGITTNRSLAFLSQINSFSNAGGGSDGQGTYLFDRNPDPAGGTPLFSIKFEGNTLSEQVRDDAGNITNNTSTIISPSSGTILNMSLIRSGTTDQFYNNGVSSMVGTGTVLGGTSTMAPLSITYHAGDVNNSAQAQNLNMYEVILTNNALSTTYRQLEEGYLAWKWGTQGSLGGTHPQKNAGQVATGFTNDLLGIGRVSATDSVAATQSTDGLGFSAGTGFLQDNGDYLTAIDNNADGTADGSAVTSGGITRLNRVWYIEKTDAGTHTGGLVTLYFDYAMLSNGILPSTSAGSYSLVYHATNDAFPTAGTTTIPATTTIVGTKIQFTLNATLLLSGYYTLKFCNKTAAFDYAGTPYCTTGTANVTFLAPGGITGTAGAFSISPTLSGTIFNTGTGKINNLSLVTPGTYTVTNLVTGGTGGCTSTYTSPIVIAPGGTWVGGISSDWNTAGNWPCGGIPGSTTPVTIPAGVTNYPVISSTGPAFVNNITIQSGATLTITNQTLSVFGTITSTSAIDATSGTIQMRGATATAQSIGGSMFASKTINNLIDSNVNATGLTIADSLYLTGTLSFAATPATKLTTGNVLVLVSNATTTASVASIAETGGPGGTPKATISGNVTVQRYFPAHRRWRLITSPVASTQTINAAWQEGGVSVTGVSNPNPNPGYGTHISGPLTGAYQIGLGYDQTPNNSPSIACIRSTGTSSWLVIPNTNVTTVTAHAGYMLFVRGGRDYSIATTAQAVTASNATLRTVGTIRTGLQNTATVLGFNAIGNPYPTAINFNTIFNNSGTKKTINAFYLWDPNIGSAANVASGTGGWVTFTTDGSGGYLASPDPHVFDGFDVSGNIQSGAAFLINSTGVGNIAIDEAAKVSSTSIAGETYLFRPADSSATPAPSALLSTTLFATTADSTHALAYLADGATNIFNNSFSNDVSWDEDVQKAGNSNENLSITKSGQLMSVEKRATVNAGDTIFFKMTGIKISPYQFTFTTKNFNRSDLTAVLVDTATKTITPIHLGDSATTTVNFAATSDPSTVAANRFYILFKPAPGSVTYSNVTARQEVKNIAVQWIVTNQLNINKYIVEKSTDGTNFYPVDTTNAISNSSSTYNWLDVNAAAGNNYYRIRSVDNTGAIQYSQTVEAVIGKGIIAGMAIYPNPVTNGTLQLQMNNVPAGEYGINVIDVSGQILLTETIDHSTTSETKSIYLNRSLASGIYILEIINPDKTITKINFENQ